MRQARQRDRTVVAIVLALIVVTAVLYADVHDHSFVNWDDDEYVAANARILQGWSWANVAWAFTNPVAGNWHPVTMLSHMTDVQLFGLDAGSHHLVSLFFHILNSVLVFFTLRALTGATAASGFVAAVFAWHPLHVESVAWVSERKDVLSTFFVLLAMLMYRRYVDTRRTSRYVFVVVLFLLALLSKPMVVTFPVLLLLLDVWPLRRLSWSSVAEKAPLVVVAGIVGVITIATQGTAVAGWDALPASTRVSNAVMGYIGYLQHTFWPVNLSAFYPMRPIGVGVAITAGTALALLATAAAAVRKTHPHVFVGVFWFLISLLPVIGFVQAGEQAMADRYMYMALIGPAVAVAWSMPAVGRLMPLAARVTPAVAAGVLLACLVITQRQVATWSDSESVWRHALRVSSPNYRAETKLAEVLRDRGRFSEAVQHYMNAIRTAPAESPRMLAAMYNGLGLVRGLEGNPEAAIADFQRAVSFDAALSEAQSNLGVALARSGRLVEAEAPYRAAARLSPESAEVQLGLGLVLFELGISDEARTHLSEALRLDPSLASARAHLGVLAAREGRTAEAIAQFRDALRTDPQRPTWHHVLGMLLVSDGRPMEAKAHFEAALALEPNYAEARAALEQIRKPQGS